MTGQYKKFASALSALFLGASAALTPQDADAAGIITFNEHPTTAGSQASTSPLTFKTDDGFDVVFTPINGALTIPGTSSSVYYGSPMLGMASPDEDYEFTVSYTEPGVVFSLQSFDVLPYRKPNGVFDDVSFTVTGQRINGDTVLENYYFSFPTLQPHTVTLDQTIFSDITSFTITIYDYIEENPRYSGFNFDNIHMPAVPEPGLPLLLLTAGAFALMQRRREPAVEAPAQKASGPLPPAP